MPTPVLHLKSPFEILYHSPPSLSHLRVFGCACYPSMKPYRSNKLEPKTTECIFLVYASQYKGYVCYALKDHKLIVSRHVVFYEHKFPQVSGTSQVSLSPPTHFSHVAHPNTFPYITLIPIPFPVVSSSTSLGNTFVTQSRS